LPFEGTGLPLWLSGLRLALHVEVPRSPPFTIGHENAGWVEAVGAGVDDLELGSPVAIYGPWGCGLCLRCREGMENYCERQATLGAAGGGLGRDGGMAPLLRVPSARHVVALTSLSPVEAAPLTDAGQPIRSVSPKRTMFSAGKVKNVRTPESRTSYQAAPP
jgi:D-arabinose 1-dehydrogenase-like Zn-dependent alcohol dehydrogenase